MFCFVLFLFLFYSSMIVVQLWHIQCTDANTGTQYSPNTANASISTKSSQAYINKYLPVMWSALKNANTDKYLLTLRKLQIPSKQLYSSLKICILKYLNAIEPIAFVNATNLPNNSCGYMMLREHVSILHMASTKVFRCLKSYKISTSITYANVTQVTAHFIPAHSDRIVLLLCCMGCCLLFFFFFYSCALPFWRFGFVFDISRWPFIFRI